LQKFNSIYVVGDSVYSFLDNRSEKLGPISIPWFVLSGIPRGPLIVVVGYIVQYYFWTFFKFSIAEALRTKCNHKIAV